MTEFIIRSVLKALFSVSGDQWRLALEVVQKLAADKTLTNSQRALRFLGYFMGSNPGIKDWVAETVRNLAVAFARKKGLISK